MNYLPTHSICSFKNIVEVPYQTPGTLLGIMYVFKLFPQNLPLLKVIESIDSSQPIQEDTISIKQPTVNHLGTTTNMSHIHNSIIPMEPNSPIFMVGVVIQVLTRKSQFMFNIIGFIFLDTSFHQHSYMGLKA
jgi:hypothetical protein